MLSQRTDGSQPTIVGTDRAVIEPVSKHHSYLLSLATHFAFRPREGLLLTIRLQIVEFSRLWLLLPSMSEMRELSSRVVWSTKPKCKSDLFQRTSLCFHRHYRSPHSPPPHPKSMSSFQNISTYPILDSRELHTADEGRCY